MEEYEFGAFSSCFMKPEDKAQQQRKQSPEVTLFESLEPDRLNMFVNETIKFLFFLKPL